MTLDDLAITWRRRSRELQEYSPAAATAFAKAADELEAATAESSEAVVGLNDASRLSGYSADHLGRLVREGKLLNRGTRHRPRVRVGDLPRKPTLTTSDNLSTLQAQ